MSEDFKLLYEELYERPLAEPTCEEDVRNILSCIRTQHGHFDDHEQAELQSASAILRKKVISSQLYDDPFRFFYELVQNADDSTYTKARSENARPIIKFTIRSTELIVETNEDGFTLADVLAICATGQSSKATDSDTTGEKGFGFKAVFGIASQVHIQSNQWSFRFEHKQSEDGLGMVSPIWESATASHEPAMTRFTLTYAALDTEFLERLCIQFERVDHSIVWALRRLRKAHIIFDHVQHRDYEKVFEYKSGPKSGLWSITSTVSNVPSSHYYRSYSHTIKDMPKRDGRKQGESVARIALPISSPEDQQPEPGSGRFVSAYLPICRLPQLPFLIQGDFILPASRQTVSDNAWNRLIRTRVAYLFVTTVREFVVNKEPVLGYKWMRFLPVGQIEGFWEPLEQLIKDFLATEPILYNRLQEPCAVGQVRLVPEIYKHEKQPLFEPPMQPHHFLHNDYDKSDAQSLKYIGLKTLSATEMVNLIALDLSANNPRLHQLALSDQWHESFLLLVEWLLEQAPPVLNTLRKLKIVPIKNGLSVEWWAPSDSRCFFFSTIVDDGQAGDRVKIEMPTDIGFAVVNCAATGNANRRRVYRALGATQCSSARICKAIINVQDNGLTKQATDLLAYFELLFWFTHEISLTTRAKLNARPLEGGYDNSSQLFLQSDREHDAAQLLLVDANQQYRCHFLDKMYQESSVSSRSRGGRTWEQWLQQVAGVRNFPPLEDPQKRGTLHWMIRTIQEDFPRKLVPMLQAHWGEEYATSCRYNSPLKTSLQKCSVLCRNGKKMLLQETWFPSKTLLEHVRYYGAEDALPVVSLPDSQDGCELSEWACLTELGVNHELRLPFFRQIVKAVAHRKATKPAHAVMAHLYANIAKSATLDDQKELQVLFQSEKLIWNSRGSSWCSLADCVWASPVPLRLKFVVSSSYDAMQFQGLFRTMLALGNVRTEDLIQELGSMQRVPGVRNSLPGSCQAAGLYTLLHEMAQDDETRKHLRTTFRKQSLIRADSRWLTSKECVWHTSVDFGNHAPIAGVYPDLKSFFVTILGVNTLTDTFMMKELAKLANSPAKTSHGLAKLMLATASMLSSTTDPADFSDSLAKLQEAQFLPCRQCDGSIVLVGLSDSFFVIDNSAFGVRFEGKLKVLDFTYDQLNTLHPLFRMLRLEDRYLSKSVQNETDAGESVTDTALTSDFRQCAYAISCCAILAQSFRYAIQSAAFHQAMLDVDVRTSANMRNVYTVRQDGVSVKVDNTKASLVVTEDEGVLRIILPHDRSERRSCCRGQLPGRLAAILGIYDGRCEKQIYRIINETDMGTDDLMTNEDIPHASWLTKTERKPQPLQPEQHQARLATQRDSFVNDSDADLTAGFASLSIAQRQTTITVSNAQFPQNAYQPRQRYIPIPPILNQQTEPPHYHKVLEHIRRQAASVKWRNRPSERTQTTTSDLTRYFDALQIQGNDDLDAASRPELFGSDHFSNFRLGAAGELFVFEILRSLNLPGFSFQNWQSKIRHFVRAHKDVPEYRDITTWTLPETADITYIGTQAELWKGTQYPAQLGDILSSIIFMPPWLTVAEALERDIEWLFEVKTTTGPCETDFFMSPSQYSRMKTSGAMRDEAKKQLYVIVRVYNLLSDQIGIRFYIDAWRFRDKELDFGTTDKWKVKTLR